MAYEPSPAEVAVPLWPAEDLAVITAPGITAPVGSVTLPRRVPLLCANIAPERMRTNKKNEARLLEEMNLTITLRLSPEREL